MGVDVLLIVDFQNDFTPGGALPVERGDEIAGPINALADRFELVVATRDWHPPDHGSFVGVEVDPDRWEGIDPPGIWPSTACRTRRAPSCIRARSLQGRPRASTRPRTPTRQGYSAFHGGNLAEVLRERGVDHVYVTGLATDYCVKHTVLDAVELGFGVTVVEDAVRGIEVEPGDIERARRRCAAPARSSPTSAELVERAAPRATRG